jgi:putative protease
MKIALTVGSITELKEYVQDTKTDIYIIGNHRFANRLVGSFSIEEIKEAASFISSNKKELYINCNLIAHQQDLEPLYEFIKQLKTIKIDGILFGDVSVYRFAKELKMEQLLIYNPETLNTNSYDAVFWAKKGIKGLTIANEIPKEELLAITSHSTIETSYIGHGYLNMFHSRRPLIENFLKYNEQEYKEFIENRNLHLIEEIRNESYPVFQDDKGTHIFRDNIMKSFDEIIEFSKTLDVFIIDSILLEKSYIIKTVNHYYDILSGKITVSDLGEEYHSLHDSGFLYKKTVYDKY